MTRSDVHSVLTPLPGEGDLGIVDALAQLSFAVQGVLGRVASANDVSVIQARLLGIIRDRTPTVTELAGFLQLDKSSVTGLLDRAQERGLLTRAISDGDRRSVKVLITEEGIELFDRAQREFEDEIAFLIADLSPSRRSRLSEAATVIVATDAKRRGMEIFPSR